MAPGIWLVAFGLTVLPHGARAEGGAIALAPLTVAVTECPSAPLGAAAFLSAIEVELDLEERPTLAQPSDPAAISVSVDCLGKASIRIRKGTTQEERRVSLSDVPASVRPRVLALVVAELVRSDGEDAPNEPESEEGAAGHSTEHVPTPSDGPGVSGAAPPPRGAAPHDAEDAKLSARDPAETSDTGVGNGWLDFPFAAPGDDRPRGWLCAWAQVMSPTGNPIYGGAGGIDWHRARIQVEVGLAHERRARGSITSGLAAARYRHFAPPLLRGTPTVKASLSSALGVTWALGDSRTPGVIVRRVLQPYADARLELALQLELAEHAALELNVYTGGAVGLVATDAGQGVLSSGGWLLGTSVGSTF
jgi:hypothetical protein